MSLELAQLSMNSNVYVETHVMPINQKIYASDSEPESQPQWLTHRSNWTQLNTQNKIRRKL